MPAFVIERCGYAQNRQSLRTRIGTLTLYAVASLAMIVPSIGAAASVSVGLGDSITFGETDLDYVPSFGDRGYVGKFADT